MDTLYRRLLLVAKTLGFYHDVQRAYSILDTIYRGFEKGWKHLHGYESWKRRNGGPRFGSNTESLYLWVITIRRPGVSISSDVYICPSAPYLGVHSFRKKRLSYHSCMQKVKPHTVEVEPRGHGVLHVCVILSVYK